MGIYMALGVNTTYVGDVSESDDGRFQKRRVTVKAALTVDVNLRHPGRSHIGTSEWTFEEETVRLAAEPFAGMVSVSYFLPEAVQESTGRVHYVVDGPGRDVTIERARRSLLARLRFAPPERWARRLAGSAHDAEIVEMTTIAAAFPRILGHNYRLGRRTYRWEDATRMVEMIGSAPWDKDGDQHYEVNAALHPDGRLIGVSGNRAAFVLAHGR